jgi:molecular chaperone GrpE
MDVWESTEAEHVDDSTDADEPTKRRTSWKKKAQALGARLEQSEREAVEHRERWVRAVAELENYKKRVIKQQEELRKMAAEPLLRDLLDVLDNLERAAEASRDAADDSALRRGVELVCHQMRDVLRKAGVSPIPAMGEPFDPEVHEAVLASPADGAEPGTVIAELGKGYRLHNRVLRPARVAVAQ